MTVRQLDEVVPDASTPAGVTARLLKRLEDIELKQPLRLICVDCFID